MLTEAKFKPGDWIRFYRDGLLVIGVVQYVGGYGDPTYIQTDIGTVEAEYVLEVRV